MAQRKAMDLIPALNLLLDPNAEQGTRKGRHAIQQFGLAVHYLVKHWLLEDRPKLIQRAEPGLLELYGEVRIALVDGRVQSNATRVSRGSVCDIGTELLRAVNGRIYHVYFARMMEHIKAEAGRAGIVLQSPDPYTPSKVKQVTWALEWVLENMPVRWWSRKTSKRVEALTLNKYVWDLGILDREVYGLAMRIDGVQATADLYNACAAHKVELQARAKEASNLMPLLLQSELRGGLDTGDNAFQVRREQFLAQGGTPAGWRWLTRQGWSVVKRFFRPESWGQSAAIANLLASAQVGKVPAIRSLFMVSSYQLKNDKLGLRYAEAVRLLSQAYQKRKQTVGALADMWPLVWDYVRANYKSISLQRATWASLVRRQDEWHRAEMRERRVRDKASRGCYEWKALVQEVALKGYTATSLNTTDALWEEGEAMGHCVGGYHYQCFQNTSRIFSVLGPEGQRVATMEARLHNSKWQLSQLYGQRNRPVQNPAVKALAAQVIRLCNKSPKLQKEDNKVIREPVRAPVRHPAARPAAERLNRELDEFEGELIPF